MGRIDGAMTRVQTTVEEGILDARFRLKNSE